MISREKKTLISRDSCDCVFFASSFSFFFNAEQQPHNRTDIARNHAELFLLFSTYHASRHSASPDSLLLCSWAHGLMGSWARGLMASWPRSWAHGAHGLMGSGLGLMAPWPHGLMA
eukprot:NODE_7651_length_428_cov_1.916890.p1 GENE.NODE_7651_length_428_cov_1.916890~~NODE_7651_length_428_cov_1.916890.p1  ORF type:complete len:116 (+),score=1.70 NODE_7651_length_428_cov_1.916890:78-425(+)